MDEKLKIVVLFTKCDEVSESYQKDSEGRDTNDSAFEIVDTLKELGHEVSYEFVNLDLFEKLRNNAKNIDLVFNLCDDGFFSDPELEPHLPAMLDVLDIPYTGSEYLSLALCLNKARAKKLLSYHDIPTPRFQVFHNGDEPIRKLLRFPLIVKPVHEDASIGIKDESVVHNEEELRARVKYVIDEYEQGALAEEFIDGREFNVGLLGDGVKEVLPVSEIVFDLPEDKPKIVNYSAKWKEESEDYTGTKRSCPAKVSDELKKKLISLATRSAKLMLCRDYCRVDFRVDKDNNPYVLEVNPNPDISSDAGLAAMAEVAGYSYKDLIAKVVNSVRPYIDERRKRLENEAKKG